jgi:hypothetical protein
VSEGNGHYQNDGLSGIRSVRDQKEEKNDAGTVRYWNKATQSGIILVQCRTETLDAGMPRPALVIDADAQ